MKIAVCTETVREAFDRAREVGKIGGCDERFNFEKRGDALCRNS